MFEDVLQTLEEVLFLWEQMKQSDLDDAGDDADQFQHMFYVFTEHVRAWIAAMSQPPRDLESARLHPQFARLFEALPDPLLIPFETELDTILADEQRNVDSTDW